MNSESTTTPPGRSFERTARLAVAFPFVIAVLALVGVLVGVWYFIIDVVPETWHEWFKTP